MKKYNYSLSKPYIDKKDITGVTNVLKSGMIANGPKQEEFELKMCKFTGAKYASALSSGTAGLHLAIRALGIQEGDEVITSPFSFVASTTSIMFENATPVFVDVEEETYNIDPDKIEAAITKKTKAILVVHIFGHPAKMDKIMKIAIKHNLPVIEDACESLGATYHNKMVGTFGDFGMFAFYPNKAITTGEGGMLIMNSLKYKKMIDSLRNQGRKENSKWLEHERLGYNYRLDEMSCSLGCTQLDKINWIHKEKVKIVKMYSKYLSSVTDITTPVLRDNDSEYTWFIYPLRVPASKRDMIIAKLEEVGIVSKPYFPSIHLQPFMRKKFGYKKGTYLVSEKLSSEMLVLPFYIGLLEKDIQKITNEIKLILNEKA